MRAFADTRRPSLRRLRLKWRGVLRLVDAECPAAWERKPRDRSPTLLIDGRALHLLPLHLGDERMDVVAHQEKFVHIVFVGRMHRHLAWRQREDQPTVASVDRLVLQHVAEERSVSLGILAVDDDVSAVNHAQSVSDATAPPNPPLQRTGLRSAAERL